MEEALDDGGQKWAADVVAMEAVAVGGASVLACFSTASVASMFVSFMRGSFCFRVVSSCESSSHNWLEWLFRWRWKRRQEVGSGRSG